MKDNIINFEHQYEQSEEVLQSLQKEYLKKSMSEEQLCRLKMKMEEAKCENRKEEAVNNSVSIEIKSFR